MSARARPRWGPAGSGRACSSAGRPRRPKRARGLLSPTVSLPDLGVPPAGTSAPERALAIGVLLRAIEQRLSQQRVAHEACLAVLQAAESGERGPDAVADVATQRRARLSREIQTREAFLLERAQEQLQGWLDQ